MLYEVPRVVKLIETKYNGGCKELQVDRNGRGGVLK